MLATEPNIALAAERLGPHECVSPDECAASRAFLYRLAREAVQEAIILRGNGLIGVRVALYRARLLRALARRHTAVIA